MTAVNKVTIYMPTHNRRDMLLRALASIQAQTWKNIEVIVVDDGSSDDTWQVLSELACHWPVLIPLRHEVPKGACAARNTAIAKASGWFITGLDDDDELKPEHIENLLNHWDAKYSCVVASMLNDNGKQQIRQGREYGVIDLNALLHYNRLGNQVFTLTQRLKEIGGFDESLPAFQDYDCWVRLLNRFGPALKLQNHSYVLHTAHEMNRISSSNERRLKALALFCDKHGALFTSGHLKSMALLKQRIEGERIGVGQALQYLQLGNYRAVLATLKTEFNSLWQTKQKHDQ